jgi:hypothetical protein
MTENIVFFGNMGMELPPQVHTRESLRKTANRLEVETTKDFANKEIANWFFDVLQRKTTHSSYTVSREVSVPGEEEVPISARVVLELQKTDQGNYILTQRISFLGHLFALGAE